MNITKLPNGGEIHDYGDRQAWYLNGKRHRTDGPAVIDGDYQEWWLNGKKMTEDEHAEKVAAMTALTPKFKVGDTVRLVGGKVTFTVVESRSEFVRPYGNSIAWYHQGDIELAHVHHFTCECGESHDESGY